MSELIQKHDDHATIRWKLLTSASAFALTLSSISAARAEDASHPLIWVELGGQLENIAGQGEAFDPAFIAANPNSPVLQKVTPLQAQKPPLSFGEEGKISFQPEDADWIFSAAIRYGRSSSSRHVVHQTSGTFVTGYKYGVPQPSQALHATDDFADTHVRHQENHTIVDFQVGKDVGLGVFGKDGSSVVNLGVRLAQFASNSTFDIRARPDLQFKYPTFSAYHATFKAPFFNTYHATGNASRSFRGVGPSLSWNGSAAVAGNAQDGEVTFDWSANAALLFGRQKARVRHQESAHYANLKYDKLYPHSNYRLVYQHTGEGHSTNRSVTVPNVGGSLGISFRKGDAKVSFGYRADFFFGAMDTGIDARKTSNLTFNGPYASISVGLGD